MESWQGLLGAIFSVYVCFGIPLQVFRYFYEGGNIKSVNGWWFVLLYILAVIGLREVLEWFGFAWLFRPDKFIDEL